MSITFLEPHLTRDVRVKALWSIAVSVFWVLFLWGFWSRGILALGFNATAFLLASLGLLLWTLHRQGTRLKEHLWWIAPIALVMLGFSLYDDPFLKSVSVVLLPVLALLFGAQPLVTDPQARWDGAFVLNMIGRAFAPLAQIGHAARSFNALIARLHGKETLLKRVLVGVALLLVVAFGAVVPLLSSADAEFAGHMRVITEWFQHLFSATFVVRLCFGILMSVASLAVLYAWTAPFAHKQAGERRTDSVIAGIVLGGILALYALFLFIQAKHLWAGALPFDFKDVEASVKSGFWQLFWLSVLNILIFAGTYRKTSQGVQYLLSAFTFASFFLLASAAHRMGLYVTYYGFSYEKFFAAYTVLFCAILLCWLFTRVFAKAHADILRFTATLFLWMFGLVCVFPVEQFVFHANLALARLPQSQIRIYELTMLSPDVLGSVERAQSSGALKESSDILEREKAAWSSYGGQGTPEADHARGWAAWVTRGKGLIDEKAWYERNLSNVLYFLGK